VRALKNEIHCFLPNVDISSASTTRSSFFACFFTNKPTLSDSQINGTIQKRAQLIFKTRMPPTYIAGNGASAG
jgi:hypothetical protein